MANHETFSEGVEVHQRHLAGESAFRMQDADQRTKDVAARGVTTGLQITVTTAPNNTNFDVAAGSGYAPNGEFMTLAAPQIANALANPGLGQQNYVLLMYNEANSSPESHETDGTTRNTVAIVVPRLVVLTAAQYAALPITDPVLTNNAADRALLLGIVTGNGASIPLTGSSIQNPTSFQNTLQIAEPVNVHGVTIISIDTTTPTGSGILSYVTAGNQITWQGPGESSPGVPVTISASGVYVLTSFTGHTLTINVAQTQLPLTNQTDTLAVFNIYTQKIPRFTAVDGLHRSFVGSGIPTQKNPHGLTLFDLAPSAGSTLNEHQDLEHANGIVRTSSGATLQCTVYTPPVPDQVTVTALGANDTVYVRGQEIKTILGSNIVTFSDATVAPGTYGVYMAQDGSLQKSLRLSYPGGSVLFDKTFIVNVSSGIGTTSKNLSWTSGGLLSFDGGPTEPAQASDTMFRLYSVDRINFVDVWAKGGATPGTTQVDSISFASNTDQDQTFQLCYVPWSGSASGFLGYGFGTANAPNFVYDKRLFGTTSPANIRDDAGYVNVAKEIYELHGDGIYIRTDALTSVYQGYLDQFTLGSVSSFVATLNGGVVYVGGTRFEIPTTVVTVTNNQANYIYIDSFGHVIVSILTTAQILAASQNMPYVLLYQVIMSGGIQISRADLRVYTGQRKNVPLGVVGLDINNTATISAVANTNASPTGLTVSSVGPQCAGIIGSGNGTGGSGVVGSGLGTGIWGSGTTNGLGGYFTGGGTVAPGTPPSSGHGIISFAGSATAAWGVLGVGYGYASVPIVSISTPPVIGTGNHGGVFVGGTSGDGIEAFGMGNGTNGVFGYGSTALSGTSAGGAGGRFVGGAGFGTNQNGGAGVLATGGPPTGSGSQGPAFKSLSGDFQTPATNNYTYTTVLTRSVHLHASDFNMSSNSNASVHYLPDSSGAGIGTGVGIQPNNMTNPTILTATARVPGGATIISAHILAENSAGSPSDVHVTVRALSANGPYPAVTGSASGSGSDYGEVQIDQPGPAHHTVSASSSTQWWAPLVAYNATVIPAGSVTGTDEGLVYITVTIPLGFTGIVFHALRLVYTQLVVRSTL